MAPETSTKMTYEDLLLLPEDGLRHEIIDGEHYVNASPITKHQRISMRLILAIGIYLEEHPLGESFTLLSTSSFRATTSLSPTCFTSATNAARSSPEKTSRDRRTSSSRSSPIRIANTMK